MSEERARRVSANEALFREVNERIEGLSSGFGPGPAALTIVCECGDPTCVRQLRVEPQAYERVRADPQLFLVASGHELPDVESVVEVHDAYEVVRKHPGAPAAVAEETDPRR